MTDPAAERPAWVPPPHVAALLHVDDDGAEANPDDVVEEARESGRWRERVGPVTDLLHDDGLGRLWRYEACLALCGWADQAGYDAVVQTAADPDRAVWARVNTDRFERDVTFGLLAEAVGASRELAGKRGTQPGRLAALSALLAASVRVDVMYGSGQGLVDGMDADDARALEPELRAAVATFEQALAQGARPGQWVPDPVQLAGLLVVLRQVDEPAAVAGARRLIGSHPGRDVLAWLCGIVVDGRGEESLLLAGEMERTAARHGLDVDVQRSLGSRRRASAAGGADAG